MSTITTTDGTAIFDKGRADALLPRQRRCGERAVLRLQPAWREGQIEHLGLHQGLTAVVC